MLLVSKYLVMPMTFPAAETTEVREEEKFL